jgi:hypothetical protein
MFLDSKWQGIKSFDKLTAAYTYLAVFHLIDSVCQGTDPSFSEQPLHFSLVLLLKGQSWHAR